MAGALFSTDNYGVTKLPNASTFSKGNGPTPGDLASGSEARGAGGLPGGSFKDSVSSPPGIDPAHMDELKKAAASGDPEAGHLLQVLASMGAGGAGMLLARSLMGKGKGPVTGPEVLAAGDSAGTDLVPVNKPGIKTTQLNEVATPQPARIEGQRYLPGPEGAQLQTGQQARTGSSAKPTAAISERPTNPRNMPVSNQGQVDAAYSIKAAQDAAAARAAEGANPGRSAKAARLAEQAAAMNRAATGGENAAMTAAKVAKNAKAARMAGMAAALSRAIR